MELGARLEAIFEKKKDVFLHQKSWTPLKSW